MQAASKDVNRCKPAFPPSRALGLLVAGQRSSKFTFTVDVGFLQDAWKMTMLTTSTFWNTFLRTPNEASAKGTGTDSFVQYPSTAHSLKCVPKMHVGRNKAIKIHIVFEKLQLEILYWHTSTQLEGVFTTYLYRHRLLLTVRISSTASEHKFMCRTKKHECILLFATQTGHEQKGKDKWASVGITTYT